MKTPQNLFAKQWNENVHKQKFAFFNFSHFRRRTWKLLLKKKKTEYLPLHKRLKKLMVTTIAVCFSTALQWGRQQAFNNGVPNTRCPWQPGFFLLCGYEDLNSKSRLVPLHLPHRELRGLMGLSTYNGASCPKSLHSGSSEFRKEVRTQTHVYDHVLLLKISLKQQESELHKRQLSQLAICWSVEKCSSIYQV